MVPAIGFKPVSEVLAPDLVALVKEIFKRGRPARISWARLLKGVFEIDLEHCPNCGGELKIIAAIPEAPGTRVDPQAPGAAGSGAGARRF